MLEKLSVPSPGDLLDPGLKPVSPVSPALAGGGFTTEPPKKLPFYLKVILFFSAMPHGLWDLSSSTRN